MGGILSRVVLSGAIAITLSSILALLLNVPSGLVAFGVLLLLLPGSMIVGTVSRPEVLGSPIAVLAANTAVYGLATYVLAWRGLRKLSARPLRYITVAGCSVAALAAGLALNPRLSPLWPRGMAELELQEKQLRRELPIGITLADARRVLASKQIGMWEQSSDQRRVVLDRGQAELVALPSDTILGARFRTTAGQFPCAYDMDVVLLFGDGDTLRDRHIGRFLVCP